MPSKLTKYPSGIFRRGKTYWMRYTHQGKMVRESTKTRNIKEAVRALEKRRTEIFEHKFFPERRKAHWTLTQLRDQWIDHSLKKDNKETLKKSHTVFPVVLDYFGADTPISWIGRTEDQAFRPGYSLEAFREALGNGKKSEATINRYLQILRAAYNYASVQGVAHTNPFNGFTFYNEGVGREITYTDDEITKLLEMANTTDQKGVIIIGAETGMRQGEILALEWENVCFDDNYIRIPSEHTKTKSFRVAPMLPKVKEFLESVYEGQTSGRVFGYSSASAFSNAFNRLCKRAGIVGKRFHDLRHTAITNMWRKGLDNTTIMKISGHKTDAMFRRYTNLSIDDLNAVVKKAYQ